MENIYINLVNHMSIGASIMSPSGKTIFMNETFRQAIGEQEEFIYSADLFSPEYLRKLSTSIFIRTLQEKREVRGSQLYVSEDKTLYNIMLRDKPIMDSDNNVVAVLACAEFILPMGHADSPQQLLEANSGNAFIYESGIMREIVERVRQVAKIPATILLLGESGVGKDKLAEYIHSVSDRADGPMVTVNCAAITENLIESELFGYESGAFTGAGRGGKKGLIEEADGGTLFLDEINSLPLSLQGKLLRVIETKMVRRVGANTEHKVDFRLIAASNRDLRTMVAEGDFREDLFYRINVFAETIPPLRERKEDIIPLLNYFMTEFADKYHINGRLSNRDMSLAISYSWPGNVRELRNFAEQIAVVGTSPILRAAEMEERSAIVVPVRSETGTLREKMEGYEKELIREALRTNISKKDAARELGIDPAVLSRKIARYGLRDSSGTHCE